LESLDLEGYLERGTGTAHCELMGLLSPEWFGFSERHGEVLKPLQGAPDGYP
jgi:hypothetical protein